MQRFLILVVAALLAACQGYYQKHVHGNENSPYFYVPVDSILVLSRPVTIPAKTEHVFFQNNKLTPIRDVNRYLPYCEIQVSAARSSAQTIEPDEFVIFKVYQLNKFLLAKGGFINAGMRDDSGGEDFEVVATVMELYSERQPEVRRLLCASWGLPQSMSFVTVRMIREQLDGYFDLRLQMGDSPVSEVRIPADRTRRNVLGY